MSIRALIVDDEPLARQSVRRFLKCHSDLELIGECGDGQSAADSILANRPDLVFLDVQMPELDGFAVVNQVGAERMPATIFVTAYDQYALAAFDANALDYLLKPFGKTRFDRALARARERLALNADREVIQRFLEAMGTNAPTRNYIDRLAQQKTVALFSLRQQILNGSSLLGTMFASTLAHAITTFVTH